MTNVLKLNVDINLLNLKAGDAIEMNNGATATIVENIGDGQWVNVRYLTHPDPKAIGEEELVHSQDIKAVVKNA